MKMTKPADFELVNTTPDEEMKNLTNGTTPHHEESDDDELEITLSTPTSLPVPPTAPPAPSCCTCSLLSLIMTFLSIFIIWIYLL